MRILLTGATGFIGRKLIDYLLRETDAILHLAVRNRSFTYNHDRINLYYIDDISASTNWTCALAGCDIVIHTAGRAHVMKEHAHSPLRAYREVNVVGTVHLAKQAAQAGIKRFVFLSTVKVNGEMTKKRPFLADDPVNPACFYAISKHEAEQALMTIANESNLEVVIIRPVLVYGAGVKGNFLSLLEALVSRRILPLGRVNNQRSFIAIENLVDFIVLCITHSDAANQIFLISDGEDLSTTQLLKQLRKELNRKMLLLPVPCWFLKMVARLLGQKVLAERLCDSLQVDIQKARTLLNWKPIVSPKEALRSTVKAYITGSYLNSKVSQ